MYSNDSVCHINRIKQKYIKSLIQKERQLETTPNSTWKEKKEDAETNRNWRCCMSAGGKCTCTHTVYNTEEEKEEEQ